MKMRWTIAMAVTSAAVLLSCGPSTSKPAEDASKEANAGADDTPKWDTSSETAESAKSGKTRSGGSPSSASSDEGGGAGSAPAPTRGFSPSPASTSRKMDVYDKEQTEVVLKRAARQVHDNCGFATNDEGKQVGPWGKASVSIVLGHNGHSRGTTIPAPYEGKPSGKCAVQAFSNLTFPPWSGPDTTVDWDVEIVPPSASAK